MKTTKDEYIQSVYKVIYYIEQNYAYELTLEELSSVAGFSKYHFHRIFKSIVGENAADYVRRVRMQSTTFKLLTDTKITQIALDSGYETNASFSKAFKKHFGITPREFSKNAKQRKGSQMLEPKFVEREPINVLYVRKMGSYSESTTQAWDAIVAFAGRKNLFGKIDARYGIAHDNPTCTDENELRYDACIAITDETVKPQGEILAKELSGGRYALFLHEGSYESLDVTYTEIGHWMVDGGVTLRNQPVFQKYLDLDPREVDPKDLKTEIYVPVE